MTTTSLFVWQGLLLLCFLSVHSIDGFLPVGRHTPSICKLHSSVKDVSKIVPSLELPENEVDTVYDAFVLPNDIPCLIVSDPSSEKASGSLAVATGAANDPIDRSGLAHFTEHAVFLGSEKYPQEDAYKQYLSKNGGIPFTPSDIFPLSHPLRQYLYPSRWPFPSKGTGQLTHPISTSILYRLTNTAISLPLTLTINKALTTRL